MRRFVAVGGALAGAFGAIVWFLLLVTTAADATIFTRHYPLLIFLNVVLALAMVGLVGWQLTALWRDYRAQVFGARLKLRLMLMFGAVAVLLRPASDTAIRSAPARFNVARISSTRIFTRLIRPLPTAGPIRS